MDDGGKSNYNKDRPKVKGVTINTQGFSNAEVDHLVAQLVSVFNLNKNKIVISGKSFPILAKRIAPYIHHSMIYKFPKKLREFLWDAGCSTTSHWIWEMLQMHGDMMQATVNGVLLAVFRVDEIVWTCRKLQEVTDKEPLR